MGMSLTSTRRGGDYTSLLPEVIDTIVSHAKKIYYGCIR